MRRLRVWIKSLAAVLTAVIARTATGGLNLANSLAVALTVLLLVSSLGLWRHGSRLMRAHNASPPDPLRKSATAHQPDRTPPSRNSV